MKDEPIPEQHFFTEAEVIELNQRLQYLTKGKLKKLNEGWRLAVAEGDDRETDALTIATNLLFNHHHDVKNINEMLENYNLIKPSKKKTVQIGSRIKIMLNGKTNSFQICDPIFADALKQKLSYKSPLGRALINKKIGEYEIEVNELKTKVIILEIDNSITIS